VRSTGGAPASRGAELLHVEMEQALDLAIDDQIGAPEIEKLLPLRVSVADDPGVGPAVERVGGVDRHRPACVVLGEQQNVAVAADPCVRPLGANRLGAERNLPGRRDYLWALGQQQGNSRLLTGAGG